MLMADWVNMVGSMAAFLVALTFYMESMVALRCLALSSNVCFITYAFFNNPILYPVLFLHLFLVPLNSYRLFYLIVKAKLEEVKT
jgi:CRP/FNR family cyclic AMP-dependent transcriptional regulator